MGGGGGISKYYCGECRENVNQMFPTTFARCVLCLCSVPVPFGAAYLTPEHASL